MATISAVIATRNRVDDLIVCLTKLAQQTRPPDEIIVVDDHSDDATRATIRKSFPLVRYIRLPTSRGSIVARNLGIASAHSEFILSVDDDSWFSEPDGLQNALSYINSTTDIGVLTLNIQDADGGIWLPTGAAAMDYPTFVGCGHLLRREAIETAGFYPECYFHMGEEPDLSIRLMSHGYRVVANPQIMIYHKQSQSNRNWNTIRYYTHRNLVFLELLRCPKRLLAYYLVRTWASQTLYNIRHGYLTVDLRVLRDLPMMIWNALRQGSRVDVTSYLKWIQLRRMIRR